ncbi:hypothetical protein QFZ94_000247 [Paraburkholderia sp. JPY465]|uniref:hypothetical protein n=1 Tax=Paraburkholderia sp. JPY465 TaxID=3042285 RepID=UPI003D1962F2
MLRFQSAASPFAGEAVFSFVCREIGMGIVADVEKVGGAVLKVGEDVLAAPFKVAALPFKAFGAIGELLDGGANAISGGWSAQGGSPSDKEATGLESEF